MRRVKGKSFYNKPWFSSYKCMMERCYREKSCNYASYGGRGIRVCPEWHDIEKFEEWVAKSGWRKGLTLDRIDPNADYSPENCRWATAKEQANNRRNNVVLEYNGETHTIREWAELLDINKSTLKNRIWRGWNVEKALGRRSYRANSGC